MLIKLCVIAFLLLPGQEWALVEPSQSPSGEQPLLTMEFAPSPQEAISPTLPFSPEDFQGLLAVAINSPVAWGELSYSLEQVHQPDGSEGMSLDAMNAVSVATSDAKDARFMTQIITEAVYRPQTSVKGYRLSRQALERLQRQGLPADLIMNLTGLEAQEFASEELFWNAVEARIGPEGFQQYRQTIVASAAFSTQTVNPLEQDAVPASWQTSSQILETREAWDVVFYYQKILAGRRSAANRDLDILEEKHRFFDILRFFKRWGIPTPLAVVIIGLAVYAILSFLTRN